MTPDEAREVLKRWTANNQLRDRAVMTAYRAGVPKTEISRITGIARATIDAIVARSTPERAEIDGVGKQAQQHGATS